VASLYTPEPETPKKEADDGGLGLLGSGSLGGGGTGGLFGTEAEPAVAAPQDPTAKALAEVREIYDKYCPEKVGELDGIIAKYVGREAVLLDKVKKKYLKEAAASDKENTPIQAAAGSAFSLASPAGASSAFGGDGMGFGSTTTAAASTFGTPNAKLTGFAATSPVTPAPAAKKEGAMGMGGAGMGALSFGSGSLTSSVPSFGAGSASAFGFLPPLHATFVNLNTLGLY
jgi:hypothetical protein